MVFKEIQHDMIFMQYKTTTCLSIDGVLKKNKENPYLKWRTQGEEEPNSEVLQIPKFFGSKRSPQQAPHFLQSSKDRRSLLLDQTLERSWSFRVRCSPMEVLKSKREKESVKSDLKSPSCHLIYD